MTTQFDMFINDAVPDRTGGLRRYLPILTATENQKGVLDVDTVKGCTLGMQAQPSGGCYGECFAAKTALLSSARCGITRRRGIASVRPAILATIGTIRLMSARRYRLPAKSRSLSRNIGL